MSTKPVLGIMIGDGAGVGPEIIAKLAQRDFFAEYCQPVLIGDVRIMERAFSVLNTSLPMQVVDSFEEIDFSGALPIIDMKNQDPAKVPFGKLTIEAGKANLDGMELCVKLFNEKKIEGFCFGPFNKAGMKEAGCKLESEHHFLAQLFNHTEPFGEINVLGELWTTRTTSHIPIAEVSANLSVERIMRAVRSPMSSCF